MVVEPDLELPRGPVTVPLAVEVPFPLFVVEPFTEVVPPLTPVTEPDSVVPVGALVALPCPDTWLPRAPVTVPLPDTELPVREAVLVAVVPCGPVRVCCANAGTVSRRTIGETASSIRFIGSPFTIPMLFT